MMFRVGRIAAAGIHLLARAFAVIALVGLVFVMLIMCYDVLMRNLDRPGVIGIVEYVEVGLILTVFFALGETERRRRHVSVDLLMGRLKGWSYTALRITAGVVAALIAVLLAWASWDALASSLARGEYKLGLVSIPMWPARLAVFIGFLVLAMEQVVSAVEDILSGGSPEEDDMAAAL